MLADPRSTVRNARKLCWRRIYDSEARRLLAAAEAKAAASTTPEESAVAQRAIVHARAILREGGMRLSEVYREIAVLGSDVPLSQYNAYKRAQWLTAVPVGRCDEDYIWWYCDAYFVAAPELQCDVVESFARSEQEKERWRLERFRSMVAVMSSKRHEEPIRRGLTAGGRFHIDPRRSGDAAQVQVDSRSGA